MKKINTRQLLIAVLVLLAIFVWLRQPAVEADVPQEPTLQLLPAEATAAPTPEPAAAATAEPVAAPTPTPSAEPMLERHGSYDSKEDVALFLHQYGCLPDNYITKNQAEKLGWPGGSLEKYAPGKCIGGSHFGNYEGLLPTGDYKECDIDTLGASSRGAKRIIWSTDGRIYYTDDHYESFELLYGSEG